jgi:fibronectin type 3 domain-containing protein
MRRFFPALLAAALWTGGCGHVGDPMAPRANVPGKITDLAAVQRGSIVIAQFSAPLRTTEGIAIATPLTFDLHAGPGMDPFDRDKWVLQTKQFAPLTVQGGLAVYHIPTDGWAGKDILLSARAIGANGKDAGWSAFVTVPVVAPPEVPRVAEPEATAQGVRLTWSGPPGDFRIYRRGPDEKAVSRIADVHEESWTDTTAEFGKHYTYLVQRIVKLPGGKEAESEASAEVGITPKDIFPPAAPTGLHVSLAPSSIEITWQQSPEPDLAGYRLYRAVGDGAFERIAEVSQIPSYSDRAVEAGKTYRYAVSAIDQSGNESGRSAPPVQVTMQ